MLNRPVDFYSDFLRSTSTEILNSYRDAENPISLQEITFDAFDTDHRPVRHLQGRSSKLELLACVLIALLYLPKLKEDGSGTDDAEEKQTNLCQRLPFLPFVVGAVAFIAVFVGGVSIYARLRSDYWLIAIVVGLVVGILETAIMYFTLVDRWWERGVDLFEEDECDDY